MRVVALLLVCLACAGHGRRVQVLDEQARGKSRTALASLLLGLDPMSAWQFSGAGYPHSLGNRGVTRPAAPQMQTNQPTNEEWYSICMNMSVSELRAELDMRKVSYAGVLEKEELARRVAAARKIGEADPSMIDDFNRDRMERMMGADDAEKKPDVSEILKDEEMVKDAVAGDGGLPGGMDPKTLQKMLGNPEIMAMLQNPKLQEVMKKVMTGGPESMASEMRDPEVAALIQKLNGVLGSAQAD